MNAFARQLARRVLVFDGAMGTSIQNHDLPLSDFNNLENCSEVLNLSRPDVIQSIHESFLAVGADAVETNTFGAMPHVLREFDLQDRAHEINVKACELARAACDKFTTPDRPRFVIGSMGPGTRLITLGQIDWDTMYASYRTAAEGLIAGGADVILLETCQDLLQIKCAISAVLDAMDAAGTSPDRLPIMVQVTIEQTGTMLCGSDIATAAVALRPFPIISLGMNCATGPKDMAEHVHWLGRHWDRCISVLPNAGLPVLVQGRTEYPLQAGPFGQAVVKLVEESGLSIVGGCCGTTPAHIAALVEAIGDRAATQVDKTPLKPACTSLYNVVDYDQDVSILNIGERTNASGSRRFKQLLEAEDWDEMISLAREQMAEGSHLIDVNVDYAGRDGARDMADLVHRLVRQVNAPLMLDSTQPATLEAGLRQAGGKCLINSANLEDGEEKFAAICRLARRYGAGLVLGTIDEDPQEAMARTADRKIAIARRMHKLATEKHGLAEEDLFFDPLVLPVTTGMEADRRSALETIEGVRRIKAELPRCQTTVGLSNVSFGLKPAARQVLNSVFLHELQQAGLTSAIVHVTKILPRTRIADEQWEAALNLIYDRREEAKQAGGADPLQAFIDLFPDDALEQDTGPQLDELPLEQRLQRHIIDGEKKNLEATLDEAMKQYPPLAIINDHLLAGMKVVGELFGSGQMQLPFVLQSAEVMKRAVAHLEPHMEKVEGQTRGTIVLATVRGDVHDIGKNLVDILLTNNGYTVHNLGIKQPASAIIAKWRETQADAIGLSGLLVKSVNVMEENLLEFNDAGITVPILLGGAALSRHYCDSYLRTLYKGEGKVYHGRDAFEGLRIMDHLEQGRLDLLDVEIAERLSKREETEQKIAASRATEPATVSPDGAHRARLGSEGALQVASPRSDVRTDVDIPTPPFWGSRVIDAVALEQVYPYINEVALFRGQWQFKKGALSDEAYERQLRDEVRPLFEKLKAQCRDEGVLTPKVVYGYYPVASEGDDLIVFDPGDPQREIERFSFPRQGDKKRLCISDFFKSVEQTRELGRRDVLGLTCVTVGPRASIEARKLFEANRYTDYLYLHGLGVESAEALAELWHRRMRQELGIDADDSTKIRELFTQHYRGSRYSFGYPACPDMSDQDKLFRLLDPARIGCALTENWQIDPEQSTSAIVVHHPQAKYFNV
jgi:5-methyltetrahydrofolate--homocysteine methyltransferase